MRIYNAVKQLLIERGWRIDDSVVERPDGELHEFIHPTEDKHYAWIDALLAEADLEGGGGRNC